MEDAQPDVYETVEDLPVDPADGNDDGNDSVHGR